MRKPLRNKKGFSYVLTCVIILVAMMLVTIAMQYGYIYHTAREQQNDTQLTLDSYVTRFAVSRFDALKQGEAWDGYIDRDALVGGAYETLGFPRGGGGSLSVDGQYVMTRPTITPESSDAFGVRAVYELKIPFELFNREVAEITVPITVVSQFKQK